MLLKKSGLASLAAAAFGACLVLGSTQLPAAGRPVADGVAASLRGGVCPPNYKKSPCPGGGGVKCTASGEIIQAGSNKGTPGGDNPCSAGCGSFFSTLAACGS